MARVLIFGASITQGLHDSQGGWADRLKRELLLVDKQNAIFNLGISGDTTADVLARFDNEIKARTKRWDSREETTIILAIGTNDTYKRGRETEPKTPINDFQANYKQLIEKSREIAQNVVVCSILPVDESKSAPVDWKDISYTNDIIERFNDELKNLCDNFDATYVDTFSAAQEIDWNLILDDGIHPTDEGHQWICDQVKPKVIKLVQS